MTTAARLIAYPEERALEDTAYAQEAVPTRIFAFLFPVWRVEISATVTDGEPYDLIDRYLERGLAEAGLATGAELARFFCLDEVIVDRALRFLRSIGHLTADGDRVVLTGLGLRSVRENRRYVVAREDRRTLYFDAFGSRPLTRPYYDSRSVTLLDGATAAAAGSGPGWPRFTMLYSPWSFRDAALAELVRQPDRDRFNLPTQIDDPHALGAAERVFLPLYLIRAVQPGDRVRLFAYTQAGSEADLDVTDLCEQTPEVAAVVEAEELISRQASYDKAAAWLERKGAAPAQLARTAGGAWRVTLPAASFGADAALPLAKVGSFVLLGNDILHVWCADEQARRRAMLDRAGSYLNARAHPSRDEAAARIAHLARQLELGLVGIAELRRMAVQAGKNALAARLDSLT